MVETGNHRLPEACRRGRALDGFRARPAATVGLHNVCPWLDRTHGRPDLAFADLIDW